MNMEKKEVIAKTFSGNNCKTQIIFMIKMMMNHLDLYLQNKVMKPNHQ